MSLTYLLTGALFHFTAALLCLVLAWRKHRRGAVKRLVNELELDAVPNWDEEYGV